MKEFLCAKVVLIVCKEYRWKSRINYMRRCLYLQADPQLKKYENPFKHYFSLYTF